MPRLLVLGYFGAGNLGDDAILIAWLKSRAQCLRDESLRLTIVSRRADPLAGFVESEGLSTFVDATVTPFQTLRLDPRGFDALVAPGGSLLQDSTSLRSLALYLAIIERFRTSRRGAFLVNQGLGPLRRWISGAAAGAVLSRCRLLSWRDAPSLAMAAGLAALSDRRDMALSADPVAAVELDTSAAWLPALSIASPYLAVVPKGAPTGLAGGAGIFALASGLRTIVLPLHETQDLAACRKLAEALPAPAVITIEAASKAGPPGSVRMSVIASATLVLSVRLHGLIIAAAHGIPAIGLAYDPKVRAFCEEIGYPCLPLDATAGQVAAACTGVLSGFDAADHAARLATLQRRYLRATAALNEVWIA